jgi:MoaA/NifB/PqqE/SkfB family radical SAM enzyme
MINLSMVLIQFLFRRPIVKGYPFILKVEPTSRCNLKCPGCIAHGTDFPIEEADMSFELFKKLCDETSDYLYKISLYITGEPLLNNQIYDMIAYATKKRIGTVISTNFHAFNEDRAERMISAGLSHIIVCLDGMSQEVYEKYRVGGKVNRVLKNLDILTRKKMEMESRLPFIEIQAIRNEYNEQELPQIQDLTRRLKADRFTIREDLRGYKNAERDRTCFWLWFTSLVTEKGVVIPCCASAWWKSEKKEFGDVKANDFGDVWNNERYREAREVFRRKGNSAGRSGAKSSLCLECNIFRRPR